MSALSEDAAPDAKSDEFQTGQVLTVVTGHFTHDTSSAFFAPLLPLLQEKLSLSYGLVGTLGLLLQLPGLLTPFIGYLADRISVRYFIIFAPAVTATLMSLIGQAPNYLSLAFMLVAVGISTASFHAPAPAMVANVSGSRLGTGMGFFYGGGRVGAHTRAARGRGECRLARARGHVAAYVCGLGGVGLSLLAAAHYKGSTQNRTGLSLATGRAGFLGPGLVTPDPRLFRRRYLDLFTNLYG